MIATNSFILGPNRQLENLNLRRFIISPKPRNLNPANVEERDLQHCLRNVFSINKLNFAYAFCTQERVPVMTNLKTPQIHRFTETEILSADNVEKRDLHLKLLTEYLFKEPPPPGFFEW